MNLNVSENRLQWILFVFLLGLYILTTAGYPTTSMCSTAFLTAKSLVKDGHLYLDSPTLETGIGKDGKYYTYEGLAFILVVSLFTGLSRLTGTFPYVALMTNHILTALACLLVFRIGRTLRYSVRTSVLLALIYGIGTMAWVHSRYLMPEPLTTVVFLSAFLFFLKYKKTMKRRHLFLCGCFSGLAVVVRPDATLFILTMGFGVLVLFHGRLKNKETTWSAVWRDGLTFLAPVVFFCAVFAWYNQARFGSIFELGYATKGQELIGEQRYHGSYRVRGLTDSLLGFAAMWLIPCRSMFFINPVLIFVFWSLKDFWVKHRLEMLIMGIAFALYVLFYCNRGPVGFAGSSAWGIRYMVPMTAFMVIVMGVFLEKCLVHNKGGKCLKVFLVVFALSALFQFIGSGMTYQVTQGYLEEHFSDPDDKWAARRMMTLDPRWNLITNNAKWILGGHTDFMYMNYLDGSQANIAKYLWEDGPPRGMGISLVVLLITVPASGYWLLKVLRQPPGTQSDLGHLKRTKPSRRKRRS